MGCLYILTSPAGKSYIGITSKSLEERWTVHLMRVKEGRKQALQRAILKYGADSFVRKVLVIADDWEYLCDLERKTITAFGTLTPGGYNLTAGGEGVVGRVHTETAAKNMSAGQTRRFKNLDQMEQARAALAKGRAVMNEKRAALRIDGLPKWQHEKKMRATRQSSPEHRQLISERTKTAMARPEVKEKMAAARRLRWPDKNLGTE